MSRKRDHDTLHFSSSSSLICSDRRADGTFFSSRRPPQRVRTLSGCSRSLQHEMRVPAALDRREVPFDCVISFSFYGREIHDAIIVGFTSAISPSSR